MKLTGAQIIVKLLEEYGIKMVAGIPGGSILPLYDELNRSSVRHVLVRQEQAAGFIAQGISRSTGKVAVCMATSGPGAMNLLTAIADARCDSVPIIAITGQVNTSLIGTDAFQYIESWYEVDKLKKIVKFIIFVREDNFEISKYDYLKGKGFDFEFEPLPFEDISSTELRYRIILNKPINDLVTKEVEDYIYKNGLYKN